MPQQHPFYLLWSGAINLGDTPGVFNNAQFVGLLVQIPVTLTYMPEDDLPICFLLKTSDVEIFNDKKHPVFWDWEPGDLLPSPIGYVDVTECIPEQPEFHELLVPHSAADIGPHTITLQVNSEVSAGLRDDFVLECIKVHETIGAKIGWGI